MAEAADEMAAAQGIESVAPLYGLPIPAKGTMASIDFPGGAGVGILDGCYAIEDAELIKMMKAAGATIMGKTNVPEYACSWQSMNHLNGVVRSSYDTSLSTCGSSGGSGSAVAAYIAPIAVTEDTGGSTRCPAHANGNFGYDPPRNKYDNTGNPGLTHFRDQLGLNARSFDDILLFDMAVLGTMDEHAAAEAMVDMMSLSNISVGFPTEVFVELNIPQAIRNMGLTSTRDRRADASMRDALATAKAMLSADGFTVVEEDWPTIDSSTFNASVNALYHLLWGIEFAPGEPFWYSICGQTMSGQAAQWNYNYMRARTSLVEIVEDIRGVGAGHGVSCVRNNNGKTGESELRFCGVYQTIAPDYWNMLFDMYGLDMIVTPTQFSATSTYAEKASSSIPVEFKMEDGSYEVLEDGSTGDTNSLHYSYFKMMHIPKVVIPVGLDAQGRPISLTFWGRAMPAETTFCDSCSITEDIEWLYKVKKVIASLHVDGSALARVDSAIAMLDGLA